MEKPERPWLIFRKTRGNRFSLPPLLGVLEKEGLSRELSILIASSPDDLPARPLREGLIAFSFMTPQLMQVWEEVERIRQEEGQGILLLAGGAHPTGDPEGTLRLGFDYVFHGEGERILPDFLRRWLEGRPPAERIQRGGPVPSLDPYPPHAPERRLFSPIEITRGCLNRCNFCQTPRIFHPPLRHRSPERIAAYLRRSFPFGYRRSVFISPNAFGYGAEDGQGPNLSAIEALLKSCREAGMKGVHFGCYPSEVRPDWVTPEVLSLVKRYGDNRTIVLGAQSGSDSLLNRMARGHTAAQALAAARMIRQAGFRPHVDFLFAFPGETLGDRRLSLGLMEKLIREEGAKIHVHSFMPLPGTPFFEMDPSPLDEDTRSALEGWERKNRLDGWWKEQEAIGRRILSWRDQGWMGR